MLEGTLSIGRFALLAGLLGAVAPGQIVVDASGATGTFTEIAPAVAAAPDGGTILVRGGTYAGFSVNGKSLTILGTPNTATSPPFNGTRVRNLTPSTIENLAVGQQVHIDQISFTAETAAGRAFQIRNTAGVVSLSRVGFGSFFVLPALIDRADDVRMVDCGLFSFLDVTLSRVRMVRTVGEGQSLASVQPPLITLRNSSELEATDCAIAGGATFGQIPVVTFPVVDVGPSSSLTAYGPNTFTSLALPNPVVGTGAVRRDPFWLPAPISGSPNEVTLDLPGLAVEAVSGDVVIDVFARPGRPYALLFGTPGPRADLFGVGVDLGLSNCVVVVAGTTVAGPSTSSSFPLPSTLPPDLLVAWQAAVATTPSTFTLTNDCIQAIGL